MHSNEQRSKNSFGSPAGKNVCMNDNNGSNNTKVFHGFRSEVMGNKFSTDAPFSEPIRPMNSNSSIGSNYQNYNNNRSNTNLYAKASNNSIQSILTHENKSCGDNKFKKPFLGLDKPENFCKRPRANSNSGLRRFFWVMVMFWHDEKHCFFEKTVLFIFLYFLFCLYFKRFRIYCSYCYVLL